MTTAQQLQDYIMDILARMPYYKTVSHALLETQFTTGMRSEEVLTFANRIETETQDMYIVRTAKTGNLRMIYKASINPEIITNSQKHDNDITKVDYRQYKYDLCSTISSAAIHTATKRIITHIPRHYYMKSLHEQGKSLAWIAAHMAITTKVAHGYVHSVLL